MAHDEYPQFRDGRQVVGSRMAGYSRGQNSEHSCGGSGLVQHTSVTAMCPPGTSRAPRRATRLEPDDVDGALAPDQVEGARREVRPAQVPHARLDPVGDTGRRRLPLASSTNGVWLSTATMCAGACCAAHASAGRSRIRDRARRVFASDPRDEPQGSDGACGISRALAGQPVKISKKSEVVLSFFHTEKP